MRSSINASIVLAILVGLLAGCGDGPPNSDTKKAIAKALVESRPGVELDGYKIDGWKPGPAEKEFDTTFTATLKLKEPVGIVLAEVNGKNIVRIIGKQGETLSFTGKAHASKMNDGWHVDAFADMGEAKSGWTPLDNKAGPVTMGYQVIGDSNRTSQMRHTLGFGPGSLLLPLSQMQPSVVEGSDEMKALDTQLQQQAAKSQAFAAEQQKQREAVAAEKQKQAEADRQAQIAQQKAKQEAARMARLQPYIAPFKSKAGAAILTGADLSMSALITEMQVDDAALTVKGKGVNLRQMPFQEFTFDGAVTDGGLSITSALSDKPLQLSMLREGNVLGIAGASVRDLSDEDRGHLDKLIAQAAQLSAASPLSLAVETLDAATVKARQPAMQFAALPGATYFHVPDATKTTVALLAGNPTSKRVYIWRKESLDLRLSESVRGKGIYILCGSTPMDHLTVTINGVHQAPIAVIPKNGAAIITLPADLDVLDLRFKVEGSGSARAIALIK